MLNTVKKFGEPVEPALLATATEIIPNGNGRFLPESVDRD
jgi:hypothetical protein